MRKIEMSNNFKKDQKRIEKSGGYHKIMKNRFNPAVLALANDIPLDYSYHDHNLIGNWEGFRECHIAFDFVLVYQYINDDVLILERLGSHSEVLGL